MTPACCYWYRSIPLWEFSCDRWGVTGFNWDSGFHSDTVWVCLKENLNLWPGSELVSLIGQVRGSHLVVISWIERTGLNSPKINFLRSIYSEAWRGEIHQGNPEILDTGNWPQTQQFDWFLKLAQDPVHERKHLIYMQKSKKSRKQYKLNDHMNQVQHLGQAVCFWCCLLILVEWTKGPFYPLIKDPSTQVGDSLLNDVFFQSWLQVMRHLIFIQR